MNQSSSLNQASAIITIGTASPIYQRLQVETAVQIAMSLNLKPVERRLLKSVYKSTGIRKRHSVLSDYCKSPGEYEFFPNKAGDPFPTTSARMKIYKEHALTLALSAIQNGLSRLNNVDHHSITHVITVSCTGMYAPGLDIEIVQHLKLPSTTRRTAINFMGCYGAFNAIKMADAICRSDANATVLIVCVELCTIHFQDSLHLDNIISNSIFADGAASVIVQSKPTVQKYFTLESFHNDLLPQTQKEMAWHIGDQGFDIALSSYVPEIIQSGIAAFADHLLHQEGFALQDVDLFAIHPGGLKILQACEMALNINKDQNKYSYEILQEYGNMSSATILFVLKAIWDAMGQHDHQKKIWSCAFGPGLTLESMMLKAHIK